MNSEKKKKARIELPFHLLKRTDLPRWEALCIRLGAVLGGLLLMCLILWGFIGANPVQVFANLFAGNFGSSRRVWITVRETALLLLVGLALIPAFKMKFWNLGGNGQILMGDLFAIMCMFFGGKAGWSDGAILALAIPASILAGAIWALIPAVFKAFFNTNESLFTLMMNYLAAGIVAIFLSAVVTSGSGTLDIQTHGTLPSIGGKDYLLTIIIALVVLGLLFAYLRFFKHGYELEVVGGSPNTARYVGINVKWTILRTAALSGAICGLVGLLLAASIDHSIYDASDRNMGFTAIMTSYLAHFDPFMTVATSFLVAFLENGMSQVQSAFGVTNSSIGQIAIGVVYFAIIAVEFFVSYRIKWNGWGGAKGKPDDPKLEAPKAQKGGEQQ